METTKILITPKQVSDITGISVEKCTKIAFPDDWYRGDAKAQKKLQKCVFELTENKVFKYPGAIEALSDVCLLRKSIEDVNGSSFLCFLSRITKSKPCIDKIDFQGEFAAWAIILTPENRMKVFNKLAAIHAGTSGIKTTAYNRYLLLNPKAV